MVCCCLDTTSLWACSIKGHRIDRTLQLQPEADIISSISRSSFLCGFPRMLKPTCFGGPTSNLICLSLPNQIVNIETWHCESPIRAARVTFLQLLPYPSLRDPHYEEIQSDIISAKYSFVSLLRGLEKTTKHSKKKETRKQNQATSPSLFILPIPSAHFPPNPLWQLRTSGCSAAFANPIISPKHQIDRKFQRCRARNSHERLLLWNKMNKVSTSPTLSIVDLQVFELKNKTIRLEAIWKTGKMGCSSL